MHSSLSKFRGSFCTLALLALCFSVNSQTLKTQVQNTKIKKNQVYKNQKMFDSKTGSTDSKTPIERQADNAVERAAFEFMRLKDPNSGKIPTGIRKAELQFTSKIAAGDDSRKSLSTAAKSSKSNSFSYWKNRGPFNVGGRTRALAIDSRNENIILAGGVSGGLWRTENGGASWRKVTRSFQNPSITGIIQDPRPGKSFTWYYISGERLGNSAGARGAFYSGSGVYKSQDGGRTFELLRATADGSLQFASPFDIVNSIAINPVNGDVYVATFNGIHRSQDGGNSFTEVLEGGFDNITEIVISATGRLYATIDSGGVPNAGFFTSIDGDTWTNITPEGFIPAYGRTVMGIDPSNEDTVYFLTRDLSQTNEAVLYRYNASATTQEEAWTDLTINLPLASIGGRVGNLNLQTGYNMFVKVHPTDSNTVFVAGTNVYRSTTGFTTPAGQESWVAGYSPLNNVSLYTNQHPDQHALVFFPSNPNKALSANDGGVFVTEDITATNEGIEPVSWTSLNNGYLTTQPYHVAFDPEPNTDDLVAGFQDNGTWFTNSTDSNATWEDDFGGDGAYSAIADNGRTRYVSSQRGNVFRLNFDEEGSFESFTSVRPARPANNDFSFINPFILDPNNDNVMYLPVQNRIWRNRNLDEVPLFSNAPATVNWTNIESSSTPDGSTISSLGISEFPVANRLYYGTSSGIVLRMENANIDNQPAVDITTGKGLPTGFVNDINVDPSNADRVIITYSNYGIPSVFITEDAGDTWTNISGNLEENVDGTGNGPSVRSTAFLGGSQGRLGARLQRIFAATSTGLYSTNRLNGQNTVWRKENFAIGNSVTDEVVTRKDGFIAVAAHGNGLFSARFPIIGNPLPESTLSTAFLLGDLRVFENTQETTEIDITGLFVHSEGAPITIELTNSNPELVTATLTDNIISLSYASDSLGAASIALIATSGEEQVAEGFTVTVAEPSVYEQINPQVTTLPSQNFIDFNGLAQVADDFTIPEGNTWNIERVVAFGGANGTRSFSNVTIAIFENNAGAPEEEIYNSGEIAPISELDDSNLNIVLPEILTLESGTYWISVYVNLAFNPGGNQWLWQSQTNVAGEESHFKDEADLFGSGAIDWTAASVAFSDRDPLDQRYQIFGDIIGVETQSDDTESVQNEPLITLNSGINSLIWPNPSSGQFNFNLKTLSLDKEASLSIFDISGKLVHQNANIASDANYIWDASDMTSGFYFVSIDGATVSKRFKIVKQ